MRVFLLLVTMTGLAACGGLGRAKPLAAELQQACPEPRPQMCTLEYAPVCAFRGGNQRKQFSNGCSACSDAGVVGFIPGPCPSGSP